MRSDDRGVAKHMGRGKTAAVADCSRAHVDSARFGGEWFTCDRRSRDSVRPEAAGVNDSAPAPSRVHAMYMRCTRDVRSKNRR